MNEEQQNRLDEQLAESLRPLSRERLNPRRLEDRIVKELKRQGMIYPSRRGRLFGFLKFAGVGAAIAVAFVLGMQFGSSQSTEQGIRVVTPVEREADPFEYVLAAGDDLEFDESTSLSYGGSDKEIRYALVAKTLAE